MKRTVKYLLLSLIVIAFAVVGFFAYDYFTQEEPDMTQPEIQLTDSVTVSTDSVTTMNVSEFAVCGDETE